MARESFTLPWTREERAEFALDAWRTLFSEAQFRAAVRQVANQIACHVEKDLPLNVEVAEPEQPTPE